MVSKRPGKLGTLQLLVAKSQIQYLPLPNQTEPKARLQPNCRSKGIYHVLFTVTKLDPITPEFQKDWKKLIVRSYLRFCTTENPVKTPTVEEMATFFKTSESSIRTGLNLLLEEGAVQIVKNPEGKKKNMAKRYEMTPGVNSDIPYQKDDTDIEALLADIEALTADIEDTSDKVPSPPRTSVSAPKYTPAPQMDNLSPPAKAERTPKETLLTSLSNKENVITPAWHIVFVPDETIKNDVTYLTNANGTTSDEEIFQALAYGLRKKAQFVKDTLKEIQKAGGFGNFEPKK